MKDDAPKPVKCGTECRYFSKGFCTVRATMVTAGTWKLCNYYKSKKEKKHK